jgi:hypothetical protein
MTIILCAIAGCGPPPTNYGSSSGSAGRTSMNGFGALRTTYEQAGYKTRDVYRLTDRVGRSDVIVWTPQVPTSISPQLTRWFDRWLRRGGRTLVYIAPDSGSTAQYWSDTLALAPPKQRLEYRRRLARSLTDRMKWTINRRGIPSNGWFSLQPSSKWTPVDRFTGDWDLSPTEPGSDGGREILTEYKIVAYDPQQPVFTGGQSGGPTGPAAPQYVYYPPVTPASPGKKTFDFDSLVANPAGDCIVAEVTANHWNMSKIIVVSSGSLLTNYAFTRDFGVRLAERVVTHSAPSPGPAKPNPTAGFLTSDHTPIPISERQRGVPKASGMELLTVWPMSLVTIHAALLGFVICMMMLPVFGRPRKLNRGTNSNFGDHLDAVAALMNRAGGENFARARISEYMRRMHGETSGPWVLPEAEPTLLPPSPVAIEPPTSAPLGEPAPLEAAADEPLFSGGQDDVFSAGGMDDDIGSLGSSADDRQAPRQDSSDDEAKR